MKGWLQVHGLRVVFVDEETHKSHKVCVTADPVTAKIELMLESGKVDFGNLERIELNRPK